MEVVEFLKDPQRFTTLGLFALNVVLTFCSLPFYLYTTHRQSTS